MKTIRLELTWTADAELKIPDKLADPITSEELAEREKYCDRYLGQVKFDVRRSGKSKRLRVEEPDFGWRIRYWREK